MSLRLTFNQGIQQYFCDNLMIIYLCFEVPDAEYEGEREGDQVHAVELVVDHC